MNDDWAYVLYLLGCIVVIVVLVLVGAYYSCHAQWAESGMATSWGPVQGCLIQRPDGRWIPDSNYRELE